MISLDSNRYIDITPAAGWTGETEVTIQATDPGDMSSTDTFSVSVLELEKDEFFFGASTDDYNYHGVHITGNHASWTSNERLDLSAVPEVGSLLGQTEVWIAFSFASDASAAAEGTYVDNIVVRKKRTATTE